MTEKEIIDDFRNYSYRNYDDQENYFKESHIVLMMQRCVQQKAEAFATWMIERQSKGKYAPFAYMNASQLYEQFKKENP